jgi:DNA-binding PadR family transcriptional regulator
MSYQNTSSALSLAILGIISLEPVSGYDIRKVFLTTPMGHFSTSPGAIYPALKRLEESGLIKGCTEKKNTLRPKKTYTLTDEGQKTLKEILSQPVTYEDVVWRLEEMVLRFAFIGDVLGRKRSIQFLKELSLQIDEYLPILRENLKIQRELKNVNGPYALAQGIAKYKTTALWARRVIRDIEKELNSRKRPR